MKFPPDITDTNIYVTALQVIFDARYLTWNVRDKVIITLLTVYLNFWTFNANTKLLHSRYIGCSLITNSAT
jgi:hypothetical protein